MTAKTSKVNPTTAAATPPLSINYVAIEELKSALRQTRKHGKRQLAKLAASIEAFGFVVPIIIDEASVILNGHACVEAAKSLGLASVPTVSVVHLSAEKKRALAIALDRLAELGEWDVNVLRCELAELNGMSLDFSLESIGFDTTEINVMLDGGGSDNERHAEIDLTPDEVAISKLGDMWLLGKHKVLCGHCHDPANWQHLTGGEQARMVFCNPSFNRRAGEHASAGLKKPKHSDLAEAVGASSDEGMTAWLTEGLCALVTPLLDGGILFVATGWRNLLPLQLAGRDAGLTLIDLCIWKKQTDGTKSQYRNSHELFCLFRKGKTPPVNNAARHRTNVWDYAGAEKSGPKRDKDSVEAQTVVPTGLVADAIRDASHRGDIVLDGFLGSGATVLAAERTDRRAYGIEFDPRYVDLIICRWEKASGGQAILGETGETYREVQARRARDAAASPQLASIPNNRERARPLAA